MGNAQWKKRGVGVDDSGATSPCRWLRWRRLGPFFRHEFVACTDFCFWPIPSLLQSTRKEEKAIRTWQARKKSEKKRARPNRENRPQSSFFPVLFGGNGAASFFPSLDPILSPKRYSLARGMLPVPIFFLLSALARIKTLLSRFSSRSFVPFRMNEDASASGTRRAEDIPKWVDREEDKHVGQHCIDTQSIDDCTDSDNGQDFLCARGCGRPILPGKEVRDGRALAAWRDWPFDGHDTLFDHQRDALAAAFAARLERHVAWIESAPLRAAARDHSNGPLSLYHYRYAITTAPTIVYTSTVWWTPMLVDEDAFFDGDNDDDDNDGRNENDGMRENDKGDENRTPDNGTSIASHQRQREHNNDIDGTNAVSVPRCLSSVQRQLEGLNIHDDPHHDDGQSGSVEAKHDDGTTTTATPLLHDGRRWRSMGAVDLKTAVTRLCRRGAVVASETEGLVWRGSVDDVIDQVDAIDDAARQIHAILCFRPVDMCAGISVPVPH